LNSSFAIPGVAQVVAGINGLPKVRITSAAASAEIYLHGAHLTSWIPAGAHEVIFLSDRAQFREGKAIRGGVPICFPWFNAKRDNPKAPSHGFVRTKAWELESIIHEGTGVAVALSTASDDSTRQWWPHEFHALQRITVNAQLNIELTVTNTGTTPLTFEEALHTYYRVGRVQDVRITGLDGVSYLDNTEGNVEKHQHGDNLFTQRTDNAYLNTAGPVEILDPSQRRRILIEKKNSDSTVVWNPWQELAKGMADLDDEEWENFVCVEVANVRANEITLEAGEQHMMTAIVHVADLA
jgi:glucose-6-phosphate 1-epimerase